MWFGRDIGRERLAAMLAGHIMGASEVVEEREDFNRKAALSLWQFFVENPDAWDTLSTPQKVQATHLFRKYLPEGFPSFPSPPRLETEEYMRREWLRSLPEEDLSKYFWGWRKELAEKELALESWYRQQQVKLDKAALDLKARELALRLGEDAAKLFRKAYNEYFTEEESLNRNAAMLGLPAVELEIPRYFNKLTLVARLRTYGLHSEVEEKIKEVLEDLPRVYKIALTTKSKYAADDIIRRTSKVTGIPEKDLREYTVNMADTLGPFGGLHPEEEPTWRERAGRFFREFFKQLFGGR